MMTLQDAKNRFSAVVEAALSGRPQHVSRRGKPAVVVLSADDYDRLLQEARAQRGSFASHLMDFPSDLSGDADLPRAAAKARDVRF